jgi:hypothetical protein
MAGWSGLWLRGLRGQARTWVGGKPAWVLASHYYSPGVYCSLVVVHVCVEGEAHEQQHAG